MALEIKILDFLHCTCTGGQLVKALFAQVDGRENFAFTFQPGIDDSDIYPSVY